MRLKLKSKLKLEKHNKRQGQSYAQFSFNAWKSQPYKDQDYVGKGYLRLNLNWLAKVRNICKEIPTKLGVNVGWN